MLKTDCCFYQGSSHSICQDYAGKVTTDKLCATAISDGCSNLVEVDPATGQSTTRPNPFSDIGARILVLNALDAIQRPIGKVALRQGGGVPCESEHDALGNLIITTSRLSMLGLPGVDIKGLDATLGLLSSTPRLLGTEQESTDRLVRATLWGDGAIMHRTAAGNVCCWHQEYTSGAPFYLAYRLSNSRTMLYAKSYDKPVIITRQGFGDVPPNSEYDENLQRSGPFEAPLHLDLTVSSGDTIMVCSDGLGSFTSDSGPVDWRQIVPTITDFKRFTGDFLKARMTFAIREWKKKGIHHYDDFSVAAIHNDGIESDDQQN